MSNPLKEITYKTLKNLKKQEIVLPLEYSKTFKSVANQLGVDIEDKEVVLKEIYKDESRLNNIVNETNNNLCSLGESAKTAETAIQNRDDKTLRLVQEQVALMQEKINFLQTELFSDSLTKAKNRKWFFDYYLNDDVFPNFGHLAFIDLNNFKTINDTHGHLIGDQVLRYLCEFLKKEIRLENTHIIRYAGDEFIVLFDQCSIALDEIEKIMEDAQAKLSQLKLKSKAIKEKLSFTYSFGAISFKEGEEFHEAIEIADERMYENKKKVKGV